MDAVSHRRLHGRDSYLVGQESEDILGSQLPASLFRFDNPPVRTPSRSPALQKQFPISHRPLHDTHGEVTIEKIKTELC